MADGNRFKSLATKTTQDEDDVKIRIEQIVADALANMGASEKPKTKAKRATKDSKVNNCVDGAAIGDIIAQVIAAIQPVFIKSITVAGTTAVEAATAQIMANVRREMGAIEDVGKKLCSLQVENQKLTFEIDRLEQYSRREKKKKKKKKLYSTPNRQMYKLQYLTYQIYNLSNYVRTYIDIMCINIHRRYKKMININNVLWGR